MGTNSSGYWAPCQNIFGIIHYKVRLVATGHPTRIVWKCVEHPTTTFNITRADMAEHPAWKMASCLLWFVSKDYHDLSFIFYELMSQYRERKKNQYMYLLWYTRYWLVLGWFGKFYRYCINLIPDHIAGEVACKALFLLMVIVPTNLVLSGTCCTTWCTDGQRIVPLPVVTADDHWRSYRCLLKCTLHCY